MHIKYRMNMNKQEDELKGHLQKSVDKINPRVEKIYH
jgi:hypothetical protein